MFYHSLALTKACESGDEAAFALNTDLLQLSNHQVNMAHLQALAWADSLSAIIPTPESAPWMVLRVNLAQPSRATWVDGGGGNVCMPQQELHHTQIGTVVEQMRRKAWRKVCGDRAW